MPTKFFVHTSFGASGYDDGIKYIGPVPGIQNELDLNGSSSWHAETLTDDSCFINITPRALAQPGDLQQGPPMNFIDVSGANGDGRGGAPFVSHATHIINGGSGSSFIVGGAGNDTFYTDGRLTETTDIAQNTWSTLKGLHPGNSETIWGVTAVDFSVQWLASAGAPGPGNQGATVVVVKAGHPEIGVTFAGMSWDDVLAGHAAVSFSKTGDLPGLPGTPYMHVDIV